MITGKEWPAFAKPVTQLVVTEALVAVGCAAIATFSITFYAACHAQRKTGLLATTDGACKGVSKCLNYILL